MKQQLLPVLFWLFSACALFAQQDKISFDYNFIHYDIEDGLPSNETYIFKEDQEGYLWIGTDKGVARFNGYEFKNYTTNDGLADNTILRMALGPDGKVWMVGFNNALCYAEYGKIYPFKKNADLLKIASTFYGSAEISIDKDYQIFYRSLRGAALLSREGAIKQVFKPRFPDEPETHHFFSFNNDLASWCSASEIKTGIVPVRIQRQDSSFYSIPLEYQGMSSYYLMVGDTWYLSAHGFLFIVGKGKEVIVKKIDARGPGMMVSIDRDIWVCSLNGILVLDTKGNVKKQLLPGEQISSIYEDKNKNIWISTLNNGIYLVKNRAVKVLKKNGVSLNQRFPILMETDRRVVSVNFTDDTTCTRYLNDKANIEIFNQNCDYAEWIPLEKFSPKKDVQFTFDQHFLWLNLKERIKAIHKKNDILYAISHNNLFFLDEKNAPPAWKPIAFLGYFNKSFGSLYVINDYQILLGAREGFFIYENGEAFEHPKNKEINSRVQDIEVLGRDTILGTRGNGLKILRPGGLLTLTKKEGLLSNTINSLFKYKNDLWIATDEGINMLYSRNDSLILEKKITLADGLSSRQIRQLILLDSTIYLGTERGLSRVDLRLLDEDKTKHIPVYFTNIRINNMDTVVLGKYDLKYDQKLIRIAFEAIDFKQSGDILYQYRMIGLSNQWDVTTDRSVLYSNLSPGTYVFELSAQFKDGSWTTPIQVEFNIPTPYWATWWFRIGAIALLSSIAYGVYYSSTAARKKREQLSKELNSSMQMALGSQINPHFIFNSLNSIYNFLLKNKDEAAQVYLVRFSRLIRNVFENSMENYITLDQEIETLKIYLELEQLRFSNKFEYRFQLDEAIPLENTFIPPMLLQPLAENAIWHGLLNKDDLESAFLEINIKKSGDVLLFSVRDNGVGLSFSKEKQKSQLLRKQKSTGLSITKKRVALVNEYYNKDSQFSVEDFIEEHQIKGTIIVFSLPYISSKP